MKFTHIANNCICVYFFSFCIFLIFFLHEKDCLHRDKKCGNKSETAGLIQHINSNPLFNEFAGFPERFNSS